MVVWISSESNGTRHKTIGSFPLFCVIFVTVWLKMRHYSIPLEHVKA
jgi:hypothetical protein